MRDVVLARLAYGTAATYLLELGWFQDGDDPEVWVRPISVGRPRRLSLTLGDALVTQLHDDGVETNTIIMSDPLAERRNDGEDHGPERDGRRADRVGSD